VGALLTVALIAVPARAAVRVDTFSPQTIAAGYAVVGVLLGLIMAYWAVLTRPVAANLVATCGWLWTLAVAAIIQGLITGRPVETTHIGGWQFTGPGDGFRYGTIYWPGALLTLGAAFVIGVLAVRSAVRRGDVGIGAASSGAVGPLLVAASFFVLAPHLTGAVGQLQSAFLIAPYAVLTGLAGSALTVAAGRRAEVRGGVAVTPTGDGPVAYPLTANRSPSDSSPWDSSPSDSSPSDSSPSDSSPSDGSSHEPAVYSHREPVGSRTGAAAVPASVPAARTDVPGDRGDASTAVIGESVSGSAAGPTSRPANRPATATGRARLPKARAGATSPAEPASLPDPGRVGANGDTDPMASGSPRSTTRSTVTAPPDSPVVARINPPESNSADSGTSRTRSPGSGRFPTAKPANTRAADPGPVSGPKNMSPATGSPAGSDSTGSDATGSGPTSGATTSGATTSGATTAGAGSGKGSRSKAGPAGSASTATPLWVDDGAAEPEADRDGLRNRMRRFGRRSAPDADPTDAGPEATGTGPTGSTATGSATEKAVDEKAATEKAAGGKTPDGKAATE
jgi:hypothetical protein